MTVGGSTPPTRFGHTAFYETNTVPVGGTPTTVNRMIVFGGTSVAGQPPSDQQVWELRFDAQAPNNAAWHQMIVDDIQPGVPDPAPRSGHTLIWDPKVRTLAGTTRKGHVSYMYGGALGGTAYSDELWMLWTFEDDGHVGWERKTVTGSPAPGARARHSMIFDADQGSSYGLIYLFGGETSAGPTDRFTYVVDPWETAPAWKQWKVAEFNLSRQTAMLDGVNTFARVAEIYNPASGVWQASPSTTLLQDLYPITFAVPGSSTAGGRVVALAIDGNTYRLDLPAAGQPAGSWQKLPSAAIGFRPEAAVLYRPGRIMAAGGSFALVVVGTTKTLDVTNTTNSWVSAGGTLIPRNFHNLVLTPDGTVLAVGGQQGFKTDDYSNPVRRPQRWDPNLAGGVGAWEDSTTLAPQGSFRGYHSTALLLPDGRVLSGGGEYAGHKDKFEVFCPPYLFNTDGTLAPRPIVSGAPDTVSYGSRFTICTSDPATIASVCMLRPGATTHAFDENQRYIPLTIRDRCGEQLIVDAPSDADTAPAGYYLLFILKNGVPSIGRWMTVSSQPVLDDCDAVAPAAISDLTADPLTGRYSIKLTWTAPGDDGNCGTASAFDIRRSTLPITAGTFDVAMKITTNVPAPGVPGTVHCLEVDSLQSCTRYYFAIKTRDDKYTWSAVNTLTIASAQRQCSGSTAVLCDGGGLFAQGWGGGGWSPENTVLWESAGQGTVDQYQVKGSPLLDPGRYRLRLLNSGRGNVDLDQVSLGAVDHDPEARLYASPDRVLLGSPGALASVVDGSGGDALALLNGSSPVAYRATRGQQLVITLGGSSSANVGLVIQSAGSIAGVPGDSTGILVQALEGGAWRDVAHVHPRQTSDRYAVSSEGSPTMRLIFLSDVTVTSLERLSIAGNAAPQALALLRADHSRLGDVRSAVSSSGGGTNPLAGNEGLELDFETSAIPAGKLETWFS